MSIEMVVQKDVDLIALARELGIEVCPSPTTATAGWSV
jgi:hypothetical protein